MDTLHQPGITTLELVEDTSDAIGRLAVILGDVQVLITWFLSLAFESSVKLQK